MAGPRPREQLLGGSSGCRDFAALTVRAELLWQSERYRHLQAAGGRGRGNPQTLPVAAVRRGRTVRISFPSSSHLVELVQDFNRGRDRSSVSPCTAGQRAIVHNFLQVYAKTFPVIMD